MRPLVLLMLLVTPPPLPPDSFGSLLASRLLVIKMYSQVNVITHRNYRGNLGAMAVVFFLTPA